MDVMGVRALRIGLLAVAAMLTLAAARSEAAEHAPLVLEQTIALADVEGRIDHMAVDLGRRRLIVAELGNGTVDVIDLAAGRQVHRIANLPEPQGVAYVSGVDRIVVANAGDGSVRLYRAEDAAPVGSVALGADADNIRVVPGTGRLVVGYGSGGLAVIDAETAARIGGVTLPAHPEAFVLDHDGSRALVNVPDAGVIAVVDLPARRQIASWRVPKLRANFPIALDEESALAAVVFRDPARVALLDTSSGAVRAVSDTCGDADDAFFDLFRRIQPPEEGSRRRG
jgi:DNA-binding beta-propeller fold protein YncE